MSRAASGQPTPQPLPRGSVRQGTTITAVGQGLRFEVPAAWVRWYEEHPTHPNLHLTPEQLDAVAETEGEWDYEFARVVNAIWPFEQCVAHVGGDGWGPQSVSYADLQVRAYLLPLEPDEAVARAESHGAAVVTELTGSTPTTARREQRDGWERMVLMYRRFYIDYGATAIIDLRARRFGDDTVGLVFMYTDQADHEAAIAALLASVTFTGE